MYNPTTIPTLSFKPEDKAFSSFQFPMRQVPIHSSHRKRSMSPFGKLPTSPFKGPPSKVMLDFKVNGNSSGLRQRGLKRLNEEKPEQFSEVVVVNKHMSFKKRLDTSSGNIESPVTPVQDRSMMVISSANGNLHLKPRSPFRKKSESRSPVKMIMETDKSLRTIFSKDAMKDRIDRKKGMRELNTDEMSADRYSNIKFLVNDRPRNPREIQYPLTPLDSLITAIDHRYQVIEAVMREYSLDLVPETSQYIICQNSQTQNYLIIFIDKSIPVCKDCLLPITIELSYNFGFRILCKSDFCPKKVLYNSKLSSYAIQDLWSIDYPALASTMESRVLNEKQEVSKMIQNGAFRYKDITRVVSGVGNSSKQRPSTSLSPSLYHSQKKSVDSSMLTTLYNSRAEKSQKESNLLKRPGESVEEMKDLSELKNSFSIYRIPSRISTGKSPSVSKNTSIRDINRDEREWESRKFLDSSIFKDLAEERGQTEFGRTSPFLQFEEKKSGVRNELNLIGRGIMINDTPMKGGKKVKYLNETFWSGKTREGKV